MNWYRQQYRTASSLGITIGKWLSYARNGSIDISNIMDDLAKAMQDDSTTYMDIDMINNAISEAHQFLLNQGQTDSYNPQQASIIDAVKNMGSNPANIPNDDLSSPQQNEVIDETVQMDE